MTFELLPAVDVAGGQAVRLEKGAAGTETLYGSPLAAAQRFQEAGASWLHFVDLDAAFGRGSNHELMAEVANNLDIKVDLAGGIRDDASLNRALAAGASRINIGTAALEKPDWIAEVLSQHGDKVAVDLAVVEEDGEYRVKSRGWVADGGDLWETLERLDSTGCQRFVVTDVTKDGILSGPNIELLREVSAATDAQVTASGGVASLADIEAVAQHADEKIDSVIVGKALYEGRVDLTEALRTVDRY